MSLLSTALQSCPSLPSAQVACSPSLAFFRASSSSTWSSPIPSSSSSSSSSSSCFSLRVSASSIDDLLASRNADTSSSSSDTSFVSSLFGSFNGDGDSPAASSTKEMKPSVECPPYLTRYETMVVLRPDITEEQRLQLTQRYEEFIVASGGMGFEAFNRGMMPLAYNIKKKDRSGTLNRYLDGIYYLLTYCAKPESLAEIQKMFNADDDVIRSSTFKA